MSFASREKQFWGCSWCQPLWRCTSHLRTRLCSFLGSEFRVVRASGLEQFEVYGLCFSAKAKALTEDLGPATCPCSHFSSAFDLLCAFRKSVPPSVWSIFTACLFWARPWLCVCAAPGTTGHPAQPGPPAPVSTAMGRLQVLVGAQASMLVQGQDWSGLT